MVDAVEISPPAKPRKTRETRDFFRACRFLLPYRRMVITSICAALFVGGVTTVGLSAMVPILRVLLNNDTLQAWADRQLVEKRLGVRLSEDPGEEQVLFVSPDSPAASAGLRKGDPIQPVEKFAETDGPIAVETSRGPATVTPRELPAHLRLGRQLIHNLPGTPIKAIAVLFGFIAALTVVSNIARFFQEYLSDKSAISAVMDIRKRLYDHVLHMPLSFFGTRGTSDVTSRLVSDSQVLQDGFKIILGQTVQEPIKICFGFGLAMFISWKLTVFIIIFAPLMFWAIRKFGKKMRRATRAALQRSAAMLGQIEGTLVGIRVVKAAGSERFERRRYRAILGELKTEMLKMARYEAYATPTMETISLFVVGIVVLYAAYLVLVRRDGSLDNAGFFTVMAALAMMGESLRRISKVNNTLQRSNAAAARIFEVLDIPMERRRLRQAERRDPRTPRVKLPPLSREIAFENITFSYPNTQHAAVENVSLKVPRGQSVAIVGRNGSGKTTLLALLPRFFDPQVGRVTIDGVDVRDATLRSLRGQIGVVTQDSVIFPGTIADNIAYGMPRTSRAAVEDAAKRAFCHEFIMQKPQGYDTPLDGLGGQLSGGQKQRLNIARAILRQTPILILDEATSQVDAESEHLIQKAVESIMHERTTFVIAHRFSTILSADTIVVMEAGRIVGQGKHEELLDTCPTYRALYDRQLFAA
jgi:ABC-type multidrug transport system fused ATPase/permease subunit